MPVGRGSPTRLLEYVNDNNVHTWTEILHTLVRIFSHPFALRVASLSGQWDSAEMIRRKDVRVIVLCRQ